MPDYAVAMTTVAKLKDARKIARALVKEHLAACVSCLPGALSHYRWEGKLCEEPEIVLLIKTKASYIKALERKLREIHPYVVPEFVVLPIIAGSEGYLGWIEKSLKG